MAKCKQRTPLPFKGLTSVGIEGCVESWQQVGVITDVETKRVTRQSVTTPGWRSLLLCSSSRCDVYLLLCAGWPATMTRWQEDVLIAVQASLPSVLASAAADVDAVPAAAHRPGPRWHMVGVSGQITISLLAPFIWVCCPPPWRRGEHPGWGFMPAQWLMGIMTARARQLKIIVYACTIACTCIYTSIHVWIRLTTERDWTRIYDGDLRINLSAEFLRYSVADTIQYSTIVNWCTLKYKIEIVH